jgi:iron complex outermembrane recepter protein
LAPDPSQPPLYAYKPEYSNNFEIGVKNNLLNNRLRLNVSLFYAAVTNAQVPTLVLPDAITVIRNAGKLDSKGVDVEVAATPAAGFEAIYNFGYTYAKYTSLKISQNGQEADLAGKRQVFTPDITSMLALQYGIPVNQTKTIKIVVRGEWQYLGKTFFDLNNTIQQSPYSLLNSRAGITTRHFELMLWGRNLSDKKYIAYAYDFGAVHLGNPKTYGVTLKVKL